MRGELYGRSCVLDVGGRRLLNPPFTIEFEQEFATSGKPNLATVRMYNPAKATIAEAKKGAAVRVSAGYSDDVGQFIVGTIYSFAVEPKRPDVVLEMKTSDATGSWTSGFISKTYWEFSLASMIIPDVLKRAGLAYENIELGKDFEYLNGLTLNESVASALKRLAADTDSEFYLRSGHVIFRKKSTPGTARLVHLSGKSGLIGAPKKTDKGYKFESLINYRLDAGTIVSVDSPTAKGTFSIFKGKHSYQQSAAVTEFEAREVSI